MAYPYRHEKEVRLMSDAFGDPAARTLEGWKARGGYQGIARALEIGREAVLADMKASGLRGRGGAGFPTGLKWSFMPKDAKRPHYLLCNADESEPGTFKDREIIRWTPHLLIEGCLVGAYAVGAAHCYVYLRGEFFEATQVLAKALEETYAAGLAGNDVLGSGVKIDVTLHVGAGAYICGEETGLMSSLEGAAANPGSSLPFRRLRASSECRPRSTTWRPWPPPPSLLVTAESGTGSGGPRRVPAPSSSAFRDT